MECHHCNYMIWGFVTALHWCNWFLDAWSVWTPQLCIAWKSGQTWMCTTVYVTHTSGYLRCPPTWVGIKEEAYRTLNDSMMLRSSWLNNSFLVDTKNSPHHNPWKMEDHKNVIFKIVSIRIDKLKQASHGFHSLFSFNQRKTLQFGISIFRHIFVELKVCSIHPGCWGCGWQLAIRFIPSIGDINTQESTLYGGSPMCGMPSRLCDSWFPPPSRQAVEGWKPNLLFGDYWGWNTTQLIQYRRGYSKPLPRIPSLTNQC